MYVVETKTKHHIPPHCVEVAIESRFVPFFWSQEESFHTPGVINCYDNRKIG